MPPVGLPPPSGLPPGEIWPAGIQPVPAFNAAQGDMLRAWHALEMQMGPICRRRMLRATFFRARLKKAVAL